MTIRLTGVGDINDENQPVYILYGNYFYIPHLSLQLGVIINPEFKEAFGHPGYGFGGPGVLSDEYKSKKVYRIIKTDKRIPVRIKDGRWTTRIAYFIVEKDSNYEKLASTPEGVNDILNGHFPADEGEDLMVSSPLQREEHDKGGIDLTVMPTVIQPVIRPRDNFSAVSSSLKSIPLHNDDVEWPQIEKMVHAGIIPSTQRVREYLVNNCAREEFNQDMDKILCCLSGILRLEEERLKSTDSGMCEILSLLESEKPAYELQLALSKVKIN